MSVRQLIFALISILLIPSLQAREVAGVPLAEEIELGGQKLVLNGAGIRTKFVFDIYVGALYLKEKTKQGKQALLLAGPKRVQMHFLYDEVEQRKLTDGWTEGFENNLAAAELASLKGRLEDFNKLFITVKKGDEILLDYTPEQGTQVTINKQVRGTIPGEDFSRALLSVWLGDDPADSGLKTAMLDNKDN